jgi:hypothetical protein
MPLGRSLTTEEIASIQHEITPIHRVKNISQAVTYIDSEPSTSKMASKRRNESVNKIRGY